MHIRTYVAEFKRIAPLWFSTTRSGRQAMMNPHASVTYRLSLRLPSLTPKRYESGFDGMDLYQYVQPVSLDRHEPGSACAAPKGRPMKTVAAHTSTQNRFMKQASRSPDRRVLNVLSDYMSASSESRDASAGSEACLGRSLVRTCVADSGLRLSVGLIYRNLTPTQPASTPRAISAGQESG